MFTGTTKEVADEYSNGATGELVMSDVVRAFEPDPVESKVPARIDKPTLLSIKLLLNVTMKVPLPTLWERRSVPRYPGPLEIPVLLPMIKLLAESSAVSEASLDSISKKT